MPFPSQLVSALFCAVLLAVSLANPALADPTSPPTPPTRPLFDGQYARSFPTPSLPHRSLPIPPVLGPKLGDPLVTTALQYVGYTYRGGGTTPASGFDCSGFAMYVYSKLGLILPRSAWEQVSSGQPIERNALQPGDLLIFKNTYRPGPSHSAIYIGDDQFVHANDERTGVVISALSEEYWASRYHGARRIGMKN